MPQEYDEQPTSKAEVRVRRLPAPPIDLSATPIRVIRLPVPLALEELLATWAELTPGQFD